MKLVSTGAGLLEELKGLALSAGFDDFGVCGAAAYPEMERLSEWLRRGCHGKMEFLDRHVEVRTDPALMLSGARAALMVVKGYSITTRRVEDPKPGSGVIGRYAWGRDYHKVFRNGLKSLVALLEEHGYGARPHVDTAPVMEKLLAARAGLGVIGQNSLLNHPRFGSWVLIGGVLTDAPLPAPEGRPGYPAGCTRCGSCVAACPTGALKGGGLLDARRCISYWTIEHRGDLDPAVAARLGGRVYGCDICQEVCPMNKGAEAASADAFAPFHGMSGRPLDELASLGEAGFTRAFAGTAVHRIGWQRFERNVRAAVSAGAAKARR